MTRNTEEPLLEFRQIRKVVNITPYYMDMVAGLSGPCEVVVSVQQKWRIGHRYEEEGLVGYRFTEEWRDLPVGNSPMMFS